MEMEAQEIQTLKPAYSRLNSNEEKWLSIPLSAYSNWLKRQCPVKKCRLDVGDGYLILVRISMAEWIIAYLFISPSRELQKLKMIVKVSEANENNTFLFVLFKHQTAYAHTLIRIFCCLIV